MKSTTADRLKEIMQRYNLRQVDILKRAEPYCMQYGVKLGRNDLSQYVSGKVSPGQEKLTVLALALKVSEAWLMGFNVPMERNDYEDQNILRHDAELDATVEILEAAGYQCSFSDDDMDIIIRNSNRDIISCMHVDDLLRKYESLLRTGAEAVTAEKLVAGEIVFSSVDTDAIAEPPQHTPVLAAHFEGDQYTEEELEEIRQFAEFVKNRKK